jgi:peptidoglycan hydrolase CwlO-like protein
MYYTPKVQYLSLPELAEVRQNPALLDEVIEELFEAEITSLTTAIREANHKIDKARNQIETQTQNIKQAEKLIDQLKSIKSGRKVKRNVV